MKLDRSMKIGIISSVIASVVFIYLIDPIVRLTTFLLVHVFGALSQKYMNRLFEEAALLSGPDPSLTLLFLSLGLGCGVMTGAAVGLALHSIRPDRAAPNTTSTRTSVLWRRLSAIGGYIFLMILSLMMLHSTAFQKRITSSFHQHLTAIAPYVSDQELKTFRSRWTQMTSERDYASIYADLRLIATTNSVRLPENKMFPFP